MKIIIIGAGILGASTAYHLAKGGVDVTLIDRNDPGRATDAAAGIVCPWISQRRNKAWYALAKGGAKYYPSLIEQLKEDGETETGYEKVGAISIHSEELKLEKMMDRVQKRLLDAPEIGQVSKLTPTQTKELFPPLDGHYGSVHISGAARVNGRALRQALIRAGEKYGVKMIEGNAKLVVQDKTVIGASVGKATIEADKVIVTAGAWAKEIIKPLGMTFLVEPQKAQIVHLELPETKTEAWPVVMTPTNQYLLAFEKGKIVVGATHEDNMGFDNRVTAAGIYELFDKAFKCAPGLANGTVVETKVGFRPYTPGFLPVVGEVPTINRLLVANGLGASGLTVGPYVGAELAKYALGHSTEIDFARYDVAGAIENDEMTSFDA